MRETRHLWIGNLSDNVREEKIAEYFKRYGKIDKVRFLPKRGPDGGLSACVAFMDIRSAQKAKVSINVIGDRELITDYYDPASRGITSNSDEGQRHNQQPQQAHRTSSGRRYETHRESAPPTDERYVRDRQSSYDRNYQPADVVGESYDSDRSRGRIEGDPEKLKSRPRSSKGSQEPTGKRQKHDTSSKSMKKKLKKKEDAEGVKKVKHKQMVERGRSPTIKHQKPHHAVTSPNSADSGERRPARHSGSSTEGRSSSTGSVTGTSASGRTSSTSSTSSSASSRSRGPIENLGSSGSSYEVEEEPTHRKLVAMCIKKLPVRPTVTSLRDGIFHEFKKCGKVKSVVVRGDGAERYALVLFRTAEDANKAVNHAKSKLLFGAAIEASIYEGEVSGQELEECGGIIDEFHPRASRTLFVGNLDKTVGYSDIQNIFVRFGEIVAIEIKKQHNIPQYAFLQYTDIISVVRAITKMDGEKLGRNTLKLGFGKTVVSSCLWVDGVTDSFTENYLASCFQRYGPVKHVIIDRNRGQALVFYAQYDFAQASMVKMRARKLNGSRLKLDFASNELIEIFLKHMQSSGQSIQGLENIRQLLQPTSSSPTTPMGSSSGGSSFPRSQDTRSSYYDDRSQSSYQDDQYGTSDSNYRRNWSGRSRERYPYSSEHSSHGRHGKRNFDEHYERPDYHRERSPPLWEHDTYSDRRSMSSHYDQDYRQKDYEVRRDHRGYNRKPSRGNVPYEEAYHFRGSRDRARDGERDVERIRDRDRVGEQYYSRASHHSPSNQHYISRRSRSLSPRAGGSQREVGRMSVEKNTGETYRRKGPSRSRSPDLPPTALRRRNSMESKSSSHSGSRYTSRTGDVDMRESMSLVDADEKLSVSSPLEGDQRMVDYSEKNKKLRVKKRVTTDSPVREFSGTSPSPKVHRRIGYKTSSSSSKHEASSREREHREYEDNPEHSTSPVYSETRSRSGTPTRDENADLIGEIIIKQPNAQSRSTEKHRIKDEPKSADRKDRSKPRDKDYRKVFTKDDEDSGMKNKTVRSSSSSLLQRVHSPVDAEKRYAKDLDYRKHSMVRSSKSSGSVPSKHTSKNDGDGITREYIDIPSDSPRSASSLGGQSQRRMSGASKLLKREYSPRPDEAEEYHPTKAHKGNRERSKPEEDKLKYSKDRLHAGDNSRDRDDMSDTDDRRTHSQKRRHSAAADPTEEGDEPQGTSIKRERKSSSSDARQKSLHHQSSQKHDAPMSIARQMFMQEEDESGTESPKLAKTRIETQEPGREESTQLKQDNEKESSSNLPSAEQSPSMDEYSIAAAVSLLPKKLARTTVSSKESEESIQVQIDKQAERVKKEARDGNLTDLEQEKERLQSLLSKLDSERHLDVKEAAEVADVVLQELTQKAKSKIIGTKVVKETPIQNLESISKPIDHLKQQPNMENVHLEQEQETTFTVEDVTVEEEIVVDTIEVTEDEVTETEVEEVIETSETVDNIDEKSTIEEVSLPSEAAIPEVVVPPVVSLTSAESEHIDHTQGYRKQMEAQKRELDKLEKKKEHDRKKLLRKQEKEKKKQMKRVSAMRGPSQSVVSSIDDAEDDVTMMQTVDEVVDEDNDDVTPVNSPNMQDKDLNSGEEENTLSTAKDSAKNDEASTKSINCNVESHHMDLKNSDSQCETLGAGRRKLTETTDSEMPGQPKSVCDVGDAEGHKAQNLDLEKPWPPDKDISPQNVETPSSSVQNNDYSKNITQSQNNISRHANKHESSFTDKGVPKMMNAKNSPLTPLSADHTPVVTTPLLPNKEESPRGTVPAITPTGSLASSISLKSSKTTPATTPSQMTKTPTFTTPSPASSSSTSSSKSQQKSVKNPAPVSAHRHSGHPSHVAKRQVPQNRPEQQRGRAHSSSSDHKKRSGHHQQPHKSSSSNYQVSKYKPEKYKLKPVPPPTRRPMATITVGLDASPSKPLGKSELERLRIELESVKNQLNLEMSPSSLSPCSGDENGDKSPAQLLSPVSPVLRSPADSMVSKKSDASQSSSQPGASPSSTPTLTDRLKLLGRVKKRTPNTNLVTKTEITPLQESVQKKQEDLRQSRIFRSNIFDQDSERLSFVRRQLEEEKKQSEAANCYPLPKSVPLFSGSKFLEPSPVPVSLNSLPSHIPENNVITTTNLVTPTTVDSSSFMVDVDPANKQPSSLSGPKNVHSLSSSELPGTAERIAHTFAGKNCNIDDVNIDSSIKSNSSSQFAENQITNESFKDTSIKDAEPDIDSIIIPERIFEPEAKLQQEPSHQPLELSDVKSRIHSEFETSLFNVSQSQNKPNKSPPVYATVEEKLPEQIHASEASCKELNPSNVPDIITTEENENIAITVPDLTEQQEVLSKQESPKVEDELIKTNEGDDCYLGEIVGDMDVYAGSCMEIAETVEQDELVEEEIEAMETEVENVSTVVDISTAQVDIEEKEDESSSVDTLDFSGVTKQKVDNGISEETLSDINKIVDNPKIESVDEGQTTVDLIIHPNESEKKKEEVITEKETSLSIDTRIDDRKVSENPLSSKDGTTTSGCKKKFKDLGTDDPDNKKPKVASASKDKPFAASEKSTPVAKVKNESAQNKSKLISSKTHKSSSKNTLSKSGDLSSDRAQSTDSNKKPMKSKSELTKVKVVPASDKNTGTTGELKSTKNPDKESAKDAQKKERTSSKERKLENKKEKHSIEKKQSSGNITDTKSGVKKIKKHKTQKSEESNTEKLSTKRKSELEPEKTVSKSKLDSEMPISEKDIKESVSTSVIPEEVVISQVKDDKVIATGDGSSGTKKKKKKKKHGVEHKETQQKNEGNKKPLPKAQDDKSSLGSKDSHKKHKTLDKSKNPSKTQGESSKSEKKNVSSDKPISGDGIKKVFKIGSNVKSSSLDTIPKKQTKYHTDLKLTNSLPTKVVPNEPNSPMKKSKEKKTSLKKAENSSSMSPATNLQSQYSMIYSSSSDSEFDVDQSHSKKSSGKKSLKKSKKKKDNKQSFEKEKRDANVGDDSQSRRWSTSSFSSSSSMSDSGGPPPVVSSAFLVTETIKNETILPPGYEDDDDDNVSFNRDDTSSPVMSVESKEKISHQTILSKKKTTTPKIGVAKVTKEKPNTEKDTNSSKRLILSSSDDDSDHELVISMSSTSDSDSEDEIGSMSAWAKVEANFDKDTSQASQFGLDLSDDSDSSDDETQSKVSKNILPKEKVTLKKTSETPLKSKKKDSKQKPVFSRQKSVSDDDSTAKKKNPDHTSKTNIAVKKIASDSDIDIASKKKLASPKKKSKDKSSKKSKKNTTSEFQKTIVKSTSSKISLPTEVSIPESTQESKKLTDDEDIGTTFITEEAKKKTEVSKSLSTVENKDIKKKSESSKPSLLPKDPFQTKKIIDKTKSDSTLHKSSSKLHHKKDKMKAKSFSHEKSTHQHDAKKIEDTTQITPAAQISHTVDKQEKDPKDKQERKQKSHSGKKEHSTKSKHSGVKDTTSSKNIPNPEKSTKTPFKTTKDESVQKPETKKSKSDDKKFEQKTIDKDDKDSTKQKKEKVEGDKTTDVSKKELHKHAKKKKMKKSHRKDDREKSETVKKPTEIPSKKEPILRKIEQVAPVVQPKLSQQEQKALARSLFSSDSDDDTNDLEMEVSNKEPVRVPEAQNDLAYTDQTDLIAPKSSVEQNKLDQLDILKKSETIKIEKDIPQKPFVTSKLSHSNEPEIQSPRESEKRRGSADSFFTTSTTDESDSEQKLVVESVISSLDQDDVMDAAKVPVEVKKEEQNKSDNDFSLPFVNTEVKTEEIEAFVKDPSSVSFDKPEPSEKKRKLLKKEKRLHKESSHGTKEHSSSKFSQSGFPRSKHNLPFVSKDRRDHLKLKSHERDEEAVRSIMGILDDSSDADSYYSDVRPDDAPLSITGHQTSDSERSRHRSRDSDVGSGSSRTPKSLTGVKTESSFEILQESADEPNVSETALPEAEETADLIDTRTTAEENELAAAVSSIEGLFGDFANNKTSAFEDFSTTASSSAYTEQQATLAEQSAGEKDVIETEKERKLSQDIDDKGSSEAASAASALLMESDDIDASYYDFPQHEIPTEEKAKEKNISEDSQISPQKHTAQTTFDIELPSIVVDSNTASTNLSTNPTSLDTVANEPPPSRKRQRRSRGRGSSARSSSRESKSDWSVSDASTSESEQQLQESSKIASRKGAKQRKVENTPANTIQQTTTKDSYDFDPDSSQSTQKLSLPKPDTSGKSLPFVCTTLASQSPTQPSVTSSVPTTQIAAAPFVTVSSSPSIVGNTTGSDISFVNIKQPTALPSQTLRRPSHDADTATQAGPARRRLSSSSLSAHSPTQGPSLPQLTPPGFNNTAFGGMHQPSGSFPSSNTASFLSQGALNPGVPQVSPGHDSHISSSNKISPNIAGNHFQPQQNPTTPQGYASPAVRHSFPSQAPNLPQSQYTRMPIHPMYMQRPVTPYRPMMPATGPQPSRPMEGQRLSQPALQNTNITSMSPFYPTSIGIMSSTQPTTNSNVRLTTPMTLTSPCLSISAAASITSPSRQHSFTHIRASGSQPSMPESNRLAQHHVGVPTYPNSQPTLAHQQTPHNPQPSPQRTAVPPQQPSSGLLETGSLPRPIFSQPQLRPSNIYQPHAFPRSAQISPQGFSQPAFPLPSPNRPPLSQFSPSAVLPVTQQSYAKQPVLQRAPSNPYLQQQTVPHPAQSTPVSSKPTPMPQSKVAETPGQTANEGPGQQLHQTILAHSQPVQSQHHAQISPQAIYRKEPNQAAQTTGQPGMPPQQMFPTHPLYYTAGLHGLPGGFPGIQYMPQPFMLRPGMAPVSAMHHTPTQLTEMPQAHQRMLIPPQRQHEDKPTHSQTTVQQQQIQTGIQTPTRKEPKPLTTVTGPLGHPAVTPYALGQPNMPPASQLPLHPTYPTASPAHSQRSEHGERVVRSSGEHVNMMVDQHFIRSGIATTPPRSHVPSMLPPSTCATPTTQSEKPKTSIPLKQDPTINPLFPTHAGMHQQPGFTRPALGMTFPTGFPMTPATRYAVPYSDQMWPRPGSNFRPPSVPIAGMQPHSSVETVNTNPQSMHQQHAVRMQMNQLPRSTPQSTTTTPKSSSSDPSDQVMDLFQRYPVIWQGLLALKNDSAAVQTHFICGDMGLAQAYLPKSDTPQHETDKERNLAVLRIVQRMRLDPPQLEGIDKRMMADSDFCLLLALPCGRDKDDVVRQQHALKQGFIDYLKQKQAAGIVNVQHKQSQSPVQYVLHVFPPCDFTTKHLQRHAQDLLSNINDIQHIMIVIAAV